MIYRARVPAALTPHSHPVNKDGIRAPSRSASSIGYYNPRYNRRARARNTGQRVRNLQSFNPAPTLFLLTVSDGPRSPPSSMAQEPMKVRSGVVQTKYRSRSAISPVLKPFFVLSYPPPPPSLPFPKSFALFLPYFTPYSTLGFSTVAHPSPPLRLQASTFTASRISPKIDE